MRGSASSSQSTPLGTVKQRTGSVNIVPWRTRTPAVRWRRPPWTLPLDKHKRNGGKGSRVKVERKEEAKVAVQ
eukprot:9027610-Lingulodinium_polyedra.AAC.1